MNEGPDIVSGGLEYFSVLFWTQPYTWDTDEDPQPPNAPPQEDEEW